MSTLEKVITYIDRSAEGGPYRMHETVEQLGSLPTFDELRADYGRCEGKVYVGEGLHVGYVFARRERYHDRSVGWNDPRQFYTCETWVTFRRRSLEPVDLGHES